MNCNKNSILIQSGYDHCSSDWNHILRAGIDCVTPHQVTCRDTFQASPPHRLSEEWGVRSDLLLQHLRQITGRLVSSLHKLNLIRDSFKWSLIFLMDHLGYFIGEICDADVDQVLHQIIIFNIKMAVFKQWSQFLLQCRDYREWPRWGGCWRWLWGWRRMKTFDRILQLSCSRGLGLWENLERTFPPVYTYL